METYCVSCKKNTAKKNSSVKTIKQNINQSVLFRARKNQLRLKLKNFQMISLKWLEVTTKSLTDFY